MRSFKKLNLFVFFLLTIFTAAPASASIVWDGQTGFWSDASLWDKGFVPNDTEDIKITNPASTVTVNSNVGNYSIGTINIASGPDNDNAAALEIVNGGYLGAYKELRIGNASATSNGDIGYLLQTGGDVFTGDSGKIIVGYKTDGMGYYTISGGSLTGNGTLFVGGSGSDGATGTFTVSGADSVINMRKMYVGAKDSKGAYPGTANIEFLIGSDGVSPIRMSDSIYIDPAASEDSVANLLVALTAAPPLGDIVLFEDTGGGSINGRFDSVNGADAVEGALVALSFANINYLYNLTYMYDAAGDGNFNDIALSAMTLAIPEPATVFILALGGLFSVIRRR
jgi:hypothetical protein